MSLETASDLRSARWFAPDDCRSFGHRSRFMQMGYRPDDWAGKPVVAIDNTLSDINQCHSHFKQRVDDVKRGVLQAHEGCDFDFLETSFNAPVPEPAIY